jgi:hypothetical protein
LSGVFPGFAERRVRKPAAFEKKSLLRPPADSMDCIRISQKESGPIKKSASHFLWRITGNWCILFHRLNNAAGETAVLSGREAVDGVVNIDLDIEIGY